MEILLTSLSSVGITHALFMAILLWFWKRGNRYLNRMLSILLVAFAVRISKSLLFFLLENTPEIAPAVGVAGQAAIGPTLYLYTRDFIRKEHADIGFKNIDLFHFLPFLGILAAIPFHSDSTLHYTYLFVIAHLLLYLVVASGYALFHRNSLRQATSVTWLKLVLTGSFLIWCVYVAQLLGSSTLFYLLVTSASAFTLFVISFIAMRNYEVLNHIPSLNGSDKVHGMPVEKLVQKVETIFEDHKIFTDPDLTIDNLADELDVPSYILSKVINHSFQQSFPEFVNGYRMREAEQMLKDPEKQHLSIEAIAYDSGFNNLSHFYNVFKKYHQQTPARFREQILEL